MKINKNEIIGIAFNKNSIENIARKESINFIKSLDKDKSSFLSVVLITDWFKDKGVFGKIIYHHNKKLINKNLSTYNKDLKGKLYAKEFFECLKFKDECFIEYYDTFNKKNQEILSFVSIYRPYDIVIIKSIYYSKILQELKMLQIKIKNEIEDIFITTLMLLVVFIVISFGIALSISRKIIKKVYNSYKHLEDKFSATQQELYEKTHFDKNTKLPNRMKLLEDLNQYKSLVILDIDDFANINNIYGYEYGDKILKCIGNFLKSRFKNIYKIGNDEFALALKTSLKEKTIKKLASLNVECDGLNFTFVAGGSNVENIFITASNSLKLAQKLGKKYILYNEEFKKTQLEKMQNLQLIRELNFKESVIPFYQCIVNKDRKVVKYEALMRIKYKNEILLPGFFMDLLKSARIYEDISKIMIKKVFEDVEKYKENITLNLSFSDIQNYEITSFIISCLGAYDIGKYVTFEILESESIENFEQVREFIKEVKQFDAKIAIDDFGSGYSNFVNILELEPDFVKIDGSLIKNIFEEKTYEIVKFLVEFSHKFNIEVVAEYVENEDIYNKLNEIGVDLYQGYYFCIPQPFKGIF